jgi:hypothetical protein
VAAAVTDFAEAVDDRVAALLVAGAGVTLTYDDAANTLTVTTGGGGGGLAVGSAVAGGGANRVLYEDGSSNLAAAAGLTTDGSSLTTGAYYLAAGVPAVLHLTRTLTATAGDTVEVGNFSSDFGAQTCRVSVALNAAGISVAKQYLIATSYGSTNGAWQIATPLSSSPSNLGDFALDINSTSGVTSLRLRSVGNAGTAHVRLEHTGSTAATFTATATTGTATAPANAYNSFTLQGTAATGTSGSVEEIVHISRPFNPTISFPQYAALCLGRNAGASGPNPQSRLDIGLNRNNTAALVADTFPLTLQSDGLTGINTPTPLAAQHVTAVAPGSPGRIVQGATSQSANLDEWRDSTGSVLSAIGPAGSFRPAALADSAAPANALYYSTTQSKLVYKDSSGTVNILY